MIDDSPSYLGCQQRLAGRHQAAATLRRTRPDVVFIDVPAWSPAPLELLHDVSAAASAAVIVRAGDPAATWLAAALIAGATAVLPAVVDETTLRRVVVEVTAAQASKHDLARVTRAA